MTANVITFSNRSASREVGKALGFDQETAAKLAGLMSAWEWKAPSDTLENSFKAAGLDMKHPRIAHYLQSATIVLRLPRNLGQHFGRHGDLPGASFVRRADRTRLDGRPDGRAVGQGRLLGHGHHQGRSSRAGDAGRAHGCRDLVPQYYGEPLDYAQIPQDDAVYKTIEQADTVGLFQIESRAQMSALPRTKPKCFADLSMQVAIIRPGPVTGKFVNPYIARRLGRQPMTYLHPSFKPFLERTLGVPLFQEQVMKIGMVAANLTGGEAEELRKAMGGKRSDAILAGLKTRLHGGHDGKRIRCGTAGGGDADTRDRERVHVPRIPRPQLCVHRVFECLHEVPLPRGVYLCAAQQSADGLLSPFHAINDAKRHGLKIGLSTYSGPIGTARWRVERRRTRKLQRSLCRAHGAAVCEGTAAGDRRRHRVARQMDGPFASEYDLKRRVPSISKA